MAVISCAQTLIFNRSQNLSFPLSSRSPCQLPRVCHVLSRASFQSKKTAGITPRLLVRASSSSSSDFTPTIGEILGEVSIFTTSGEPVLFKDLWDQEEVSFVLTLDFRYCYLHLLSYVIIKFCNSVIENLSRLWFYCQDQWLNFALAISLVDTDDSDFRLSYL